MAVTFQGIDYATGSAADIVRAMLAPYGLGDLAQRMYAVGKETGSAEAAYLWLRDQPEYKREFAGMELRQKNGFDPIDEKQYLDWKSQMISTMRNNGIPPGFYDSPDDFATFIGNDVSVKEVQDRVVNGVVAARNAPPEVKQALFEYYGIDEGGLAAYWIDPTPGRGAQLLRQQAATFAGAAAKMGGFQGLNRQEAEGLAAYGKSQEEMTQAFGDLTQGKELLDALPGEVLAQMSREEQLQYVSGSQEARQELQRRAQQRKAQFGGGGSFAESQQGVAGLGTAQK